MNTKSLTIQGLPRRTFWYPDNTNHLRMPATTAHYPRRERHVALFSSLCDHSDRFLDVLFVPVSLG